MIIFSHIHTKAGTTYYVIHPENHLKIGGTDLLQVMTKRRPNQKEQNGQSHGSDQNPYHAHRWEGGRYRAMRGPSLDIPGPGHLQQEDGF